VKLKRITTYELAAPLARPFAYSQHWRTNRWALLLELTAQDGTTGWGEGGYAPAPAAAAIHREYAPILRGIDTFDFASTWERLYNYSRDYGRSGAMVVAISAIDIALFDIMGKSLGLPAHKLLGGTFRDRVPIYATGCYPHDLGNIVEEVTAEAKQHIASGHRAVKLKIGFGVNLDVRLVRAVREALGPDIRLMVDANHAYTADQAIVLGLAIQPLDIYWFEEPVVPEDLAGYRRVRDALSIPIAGGESEYTRWGFRQLLESGAVDIVQPDVTLAGGVSECRTIAYLASSFSARCNPHAWGTSVSIGATLQLLAAIPDCPPRLLPETPMLEADVTPNPLREDITDWPFVLKDGCIMIPSEPGLGVQVDPDRLAKWTVNKTITEL